MVNPARRPSTSTSSSFLNNRSFILYAVILCFVIFATIILFSSSHHSSSSFQSLQQAADDSSSTLMDEHHQKHQPKTKQEADDDHVVDSLEEASPTPPPQQKVVTRSARSKNFKPIINLNAHYKPKIHFITVQTNLSPGWCRNMNSAKKSGISVTSLGWGQSYSHVIRPSWIVSFLSQTKSSSSSPSSSSSSSLLHHPEDVVLFADGSDTMFTGVDKQTILKRFEHIAKTDFGGRRDFVMFNAEANCFHQQLFPKPWGVMKGRCISVYKAFDPSIRTKWRYLNAGAWIGTVRAAIWWFSNASKIVSQDKSWWCDQSIIGGMMLRQTKTEKDRSKHLAVLDTKNSIFLPTYHFRAKDDVCDVVSNNGHDDQSSSSSSSALFHHPPKLVLCHSNRAPAVLHFNGKSGNSGIEAEKRVQYPTKSEDQEDQGVNDDDHSTIFTWDTKVGSVPVAQSFKKMCPKY